MSFNGETLLMLRRRNGGHTYKMGRLRIGKPRIREGLRVNKLDIDSG